MPASATTPLEELKFSEAENEQNRHAYSVALATAAAAEAAVVAAQAATEVVRLTSVGHYSGKTKEEVATIKIQNAFRRYLVLILPILRNIYIFKMAIFV